MADNLGFSYELDDCQEDIEVINPEGEEREQDMLPSMEPLLNGKGRYRPMLETSVSSRSEWGKDILQRGSQGSQDAFCPPSTSNSQQGVTGYSSMVPIRHVPNDPFLGYMGPGMTPSQKKGQYVPMMNPNVMGPGDTDMSHMGISQLHAKYMGVHLGMMPESLGPQEGMMGNVSGGSNSMMGNDPPQSKNMIGKMRGQSRNMMGGMNGPKSIMGNTNPPNSMIENGMSIPYSTAASVGTSQSGSRMGLNIKRKTAASSQYQYYSKQPGPYLPKGMPPRSHRVSDPGSMYSAPSSKHPEPECRDGHLTPAVSGLQPNHMPGLVSPQGIMAQEIFLTAGASLLNLGAKPAMLKTPVQRPKVPGIKPVGSKISFQIEVGKGIVITWKTILVDGKLYIEIPNMISNESLVTLLEYAEEKLECSYVILCLKKNGTDLAADWLHTFMFLGFCVAQPGNPLVPKAKDFLFLVYAIDSCDS